jgi:F0F1-type ATP synthase assembly protein I
MILAVYMLSARLTTHWGSTLKQALRHPLFLVGVVLVTTSFCFGLSTGDWEYVLRIAAPSLLIPGAVFMVIEWLHRG